MKIILGFTGIYSCFVILSVLIITGASDVKALSQDNFEKVVVQSYLNRVKGALTYLYGTENRSCAQNQRFYVQRYKYSLRQIDHAMESTDCYTVLSELLRLDTYIAGSNTSPGPYNCPPDDAPIFLTQREAIRAMKKMADDIPNQFSQCN